MLKQQVTEQFLRSLRHLQYGSVSVITPDGQQHDYEGQQSGAHAVMRVYDWRTITSFAAKGDIGLTEAYRDGWWDTDDLTALLTVGLQNETALEPYLYGSWLGRLAARMMYYFNVNTLKGSKRNIHAHYDLGNAFFSLWLDPSMSYSSALFPSNETPLQDAQYQKYDRILERLERTSGRLLEVGCGWGGFAERAMQQGDYDFKGITLSNEQHAYAANRMHDKANIVIEDYRHQRGQYDQIVSIEMFEAVGEKFWPVYFQKMRELLAEKGKAVIQTITIGESYFDRYRQGGDMIRSFIFPGGMLPSPTRFKDEAAKAGLRLTDRFEFGQDYAHTLRHWLDAFEAKLPQVQSLGFDERFIRVWRFYLAACIASFSVGRTDVMQMELQHA